MGSKFFGFFTSKNIPPLCWIYGWKKIFIFNKSDKSTIMQLFMDSQIHGNREVPECCCCRPSSIYQLFCESLGVNYSYHMWWFPKKEAGELFIPLPVVVTEKLLSVYIIPCHQWTTTTTTTTTTFVCLRHSMSSVDTLLHSLLPGDKNKLIGNRLKRAKN